MKIIDVEAVVLRQASVNEAIADGSQDDLVILVSTDEGIIGIGEVDSAPEAVRALVHVLEEDHPGRRPSVGVGRRERHRLGQRNVGGDGLVVPTPELFERVCSEFVFAKIHGRVCVGRNRGAADDFGRFIIPRARRGPRRR